MKKKLFRIALLILMILPFIALAHFFAYPQETRCMLIRFAPFEKTGNIYHRKDVPVQKIDEINILQTAARKRNSLFWGNNIILQYDLIFCNTEADYNKYGVAGTPACTQCKGGPYIVLSNDGLDASVIAHETAHAVLYNNIGWYKNNFKIPVWFSEGLAMQVDDRPYYAVDSLLAKQATGLIIPDVSRVDFFSGDSKTLMLHFSAAKYKIAEWMKTHALHKFINRINNGISFEKAYGEKD